MTELGALLPRLVGDVPGDASRLLARRLRRVESRNVTYLSETFPVFWEEARGANVRDVDGNVYLDLTGAFGVALAGHAHPRIVEAVRARADRLLHAMGDVHPSSAKVELLERLVTFSPWSEARGVLASTGSEAVEIGLKTALMATGRPGILTFEGAYHGLTLGALAVTARPHFRDPFEARLFEGVASVPFPTNPEDAASVLREVDEVLAAGAPGGHAVGTVLVEPVQGRAGIRIPPAGFLAELARRARDAGALVVVDEVFTGAGRSGRFLASERLGLEPDVVCLGKALGGGVPLSACLATPAVMDAWPPSTGEAIHTSTFLGHPVGCAAGLAMLELLERGLAADAERVGRRLLDGLRDALAGVRGVGEVRGLGAMIGIGLVEGDAADPAEGAGARIAERLLAEGVLVLPAGPRAEVVELTPPAVLTDEQMDFAVGCIAGAVKGAVS